MLFDKIFSVLKNILQYNFIVKTIFTVFNFFKYRKNLRNCLLNDTLDNSGLSKIDFNIHKITALNLLALKAHGIKALILDYDGVLSPHGDLEPLPEVLNWLTEAIQAFGPNKIFILSNNPKLQRKDFLDRYFNNQIVFIISRPKPYTDGIAEIYLYLQANGMIALKKEDLLLVDDRLGTGILAAKIFGTSSCLIVDPYIGMRKNFLIESTFIIVRKLERFMIWHL